MTIPVEVLKMERKPAPILSPKFGPLQGLRVLSTTSVIAGPFCPSLFAWFGADVFSVDNFEDYLELCGGIKKLNYLKKREFLREPMIAPWRKEG